ncbi:MAG: CYTH and CHAD domain-containing protein [Chloroflexi bacterium]|nr:MAG: CYTH and CHAD domain-containing protein [Chloroflexota bacterium]
MVERELKLSAGPGFQLPDLDGILPGVEAEQPEFVRMQTIYHDTPDLRLARWGCSLRHRSGEGWTLKLPTSATGPLLERTELTFPGGAGKAPAAALAVVRAYVRHAPLEPVARLSTRRRITRLRAKGRKLAEVVDDEVTVLEGRRVAGRFREIEIELAEAGDELLEPLRRRLEEGGAGATDGTPKHVRALGPRAAAPPEVDPRPVSTGATAGELLAHAVQESVAALLRHDPGVRLGSDPEHVHQARVAVRRLRSNLRTFAKLLDVEALGSLSEDLKALGGALGAVRDGEVLEERLRGRAEALPPGDRRLAGELVRRLEEEIASKRVAALALMDSERYLDLLDRLVQLARLPPLNEVATMAAEQVAGELARRPWRKLRKAVQALPGEPADAELHRVRILAKRARYAAEAVAPVVGKPAAQFAKAAAELQTVLGDHQDSVTAEAWLRGLNTSGRRSFVAGQLAAMERVAAEESRAKWRKAWAALESKRLREWMG